MYVCAPVTLMLYCTYYCYSTPRRTRLKRHGRMRPPPHLTSQRIRLRAFPRLADVSLGPAGCAALGIGSLARFAGKRSNSSRGPGGGRAQQREKKCRVSRLETGLGMEGRGRSWGDRVWGASGLGRWVSATCGGRTNSSGRQVSRRHGAYEVLASVRVRRKANWA